MDYSKMIDKEIQKLNAISVKTYCKNILSKNRDVLKFVSPITKNNKINSIRVIVKTNGVLMVIYTSIQKIIF